MSVIAAVTSADVEALRRKAKKLVKETGVAHHAALDAVARAGKLFPNWHHLIEAAKATEPAEHAFRQGWVIGMDIKDANDALDARLTQFVRDDRLIPLVFREFGVDITSRGLGLEPSGEDPEHAWHAELLHQTVFYRSRRLLPASREEALAIAHKEFFFRPEYMRLKGQLLVDPFDEEDHPDGVWPQ